MKMKALSLRVRMMILFCLVVGVVLSGLSLGFYELLRRQVREQSDRGLLAAARPMIADLKSDPTEQDVAQLNIPNQYFELFDAAGRPEERSKNLIQDGISLPATVPAGSSPVFGIVRSGGRRLRVAYLPFDRGGKRVALAAAVPTGPADQVFKTLRGIIALILPLALGVTALISVWYVGRSLRPVEELTARATSIADQLSVSPAVPRAVRTPLPHLAAGDSAYELAQLSSAFNTLIARMTAALGQLTQFVSDASHELRTPLSVLRGETELLLSEPRSADEYRNALEVMDGELKKLTRIVESLFTLALADAGELRVEAEPLYLNEVLEEACALVSGRAEARGIRLERNLSREVSASGDETFLRQLFLIFLDNAIKYSGAGTTIRVGIEAGKDVARVSIEDRGIGIAPDHLPHIYERFYRAAPSADGETQSGGLGLSIARAIVNAHGGTIECSSEPGKGSRFVVTLPQAPAWRRETVPRET